MRLTVCKIDITNLVLNSKYDNVKVHGAEATNPLPTTRGVTDLYRNCGRLLVNAQDGTTPGSTVCSKLQV